MASKFTRVGRGQLIADSRYVLVWGTNAKGVLTDTQTGHTTTVSEPGCSSAAAIGGLSIVFACNGPSYELFNITTGRSAELRLNLSVVANGKVTAVGADWLALAASCEMEHCGSTQFFYQSLSDGTIAPDPSAGSTTVDLDSPTLSHTLCSPVTVPSAPSYPFDHYGAASILVDGRFAVSTSGGGSYLARCGSQLHQFLTYTSYPGCAHETCAPPANSNLIVWQSAPLRLSGIFLPTRHPFVIALPAEIDPTPGPYVNGDRYALALTSHALYVAHNGSVWMAPAPGDLTVKGSSLSGLTRRNAELGLTASTPAHNPQIRSVAIVLPRRLSFAKDRKALKSNITANGSQTQLVRQPTAILVAKFRHAVAKTTILIRPGAVVKGRQLLTTAKRKRTRQTASR